MRLQYLSQVVIIFVLYSLGTIVRSLNSEPTSGTAPNIIIAVIIIIITSIRFQPKCSITIIMTEISDQRRVPNACNQTDSCNRRRRSSDDRKIYHAERCEDSMVIFVYAVVV